mmetsp:Transcript_11501/g.47837  ORF Transcript_11501/g.47837 Transcript_11501/m.47837 type:complete len:167 (+) Transcript_11501:629-1129(+)
MAVQKMLAIEKLKRSLWESTGREPTLLEVAKIRNTDVDTISRYLDEGRKSRHALVEENLRLVSSIACRFVGRGVAIQDLVQEGACGLVQAVEKYDASKGVRSNPTPCMHWTRSSILCSDAAYSWTVFRRSFRPMQRSGSRSISDSRFTTTQDQSGSPGRFKTSFCI